MVATTVPHGHADERALAGLVMLVNQARGQEHGKAHQEIRQFTHALGGGVQQAQQALDQQNQRARHRAHGEGAQQHRQVAQVQLVEEHDRNLDHEQHGRDGGQDGHGGQLAGW